MKRAGSVAALVIALAGAGLAGCTSKSESAEGATTIDVVNKDDACNLSAVAAPAGKVVFDVKNEGTKVTEFYLKNADGSKIIGEVENIGPGVSRKMTVTVDAGAYMAICKPGEQGDGLSTAFVVG
jgi:iron uptake system component EfeO